MIPYITFSDFWPFDINPFGTLIALGYFAGALWVIKHRHYYGISTWRVIDICIWVTIPAFLGSHLFLIIFYHPERILHDPMSLLRFNQGISSIGGLLSAFFAVLLYARWNSEKLNWLQVGDIATQGFIVGWIFGRLACSLAHDHPGLSSNFFLAIQYPDGSRHDLGFYEFLYTLFIIFPLSTWLARKKSPPGSQIVLLMVTFSLFRLPMDSLRIFDTTYFGWTPAQYASVLMLILAAIIIKTMKTNMNIKK